MERLIKQWEQKLKSYQSMIDGLPVENRDKSFWLGKKVALEIAIEELKNFISFNFPVSGQLPLSDEEFRRENIANRKDLDRMRERNRR